MVLLLLSALVVLYICTFVSLRWDVETPLASGLFEVDRVNWTELRQS